MATPHIGAEPGDFADSILLPGDPLRARHIAEQFLDDAVQVTDVRNMLGYTGTYRGSRVSVMGTGMGIPSAAIYIQELIVDYSVERLVRVGTCGAVAPDVELRDVILAIGACTESGFNRSRYAGLDFAATADFGLLVATAQAAEVMGIPVRVGNVHSGDMFYKPDRSVFQAMLHMGVLAAEMEAAALYGLAAQYGVRALTIVTASDHLGTGARTSWEERQESFDDMVSLALGGLQTDTTMSRRQLNERNPSE